MGKRLAICAVVIGLSWGAAAQSVTDWVGRGPGELLAAPEWQAALTGVMGRDGLQRLRDDLVIEEPISQQGDWIVATGCAPHQCADVMGGFAVSVTSGQIVAVVRDDAGIKLWGDAGDLPPALARIAQP